MPAARLLCCAALLWRSEGLGQSHASLALEVTSSGSVRRLVRREAFAEDEGGAPLGAGAGNFTTGGGAEGGGANASMGVLGTNISETAGPCDERQRMCCKPASAKADPRGLYLMCLQRNCQKMDKPDPICQAHGICTKTCASGCCCFWLGTVYRMKAAMLWVKQFLFRVAAMLLAFQETSVQAAEGQRSSKVVERYDPAEAAAHAVDVLLDAVKWGLGIPIFSLVAVLLQGRVVGIYRELAHSRGKRRPTVLLQQTEEGVGEGESEYEVTARKELGQFLEEKEQDRLGGVQKIIMAKMSGISDAMWMVTQALGVGLYHCLMQECAQTGFVVLGNSGRVLVLIRKPMLTAVSAGRMFRGIGITHILLVMIANTYLRAIEHTLTKAQRSKDPQVRQKAVQAAPLANLIQGNVSYATLVFAILLWLFFYFTTKTSIRPWGTADERNFYESKEASVCQYFRTGSRGLIPCLSRRRQMGGLRIFFGPFPEPHIFDHLGGAGTLKNLEPCLHLPTETDNGYPPSGSGQPASAEQKAATAGLFLSFLNSFLGTLGLVIFGIHIYNFLTNVQNCPIGNIVRDCVGELHCTGVAKTPWLQHHLLSNGLRSATEIAADQVLPKVETEMLATWLHISIGEVSQKVLSVSREACGLRYKELFVDPNSTLQSGSSDTIGKLNAANYMYAVAKYGYKIKFDESAMHCKDCVRSYFMYYFTNFDNLIEIVEVLMLAVTTYVSALVYRMTTRKLHNCPMVDLAFASDPGSAAKLDVEGLEKMCLAMIGHCFFFRYSFLGVPSHMAELERALRRDEAQSQELPDPWCQSNCTSWNDYDLTSPSNRRMMVVNRQLLGILEGEEIVAAWSETPMLTLWQKLSIFGGSLFCFLLPMYVAATKKSSVCAAEAVVMELLHWGLVSLFIFWRRPQAGFVLTSRRLFQVSRLPAYRDIFGKTEPMLKLDVIIHNSGISYASMTMEAYAPLWRRVLGKFVRVPVFRRGQMIMEGKEGIFKLWRSIGDTREVFKSISKVTHMTKLDSLVPQLGERFIQEEEEASQREADNPDPIGSLCCCPHTPPPLDMDAGPLLERYLARKDRELDVYNRQLCMRPCTCGELWCGRGCSVECSFCCCCRLDELATDCVVTTHRILVEQRTVQRYCRWFACCRSTPNVRTTYLAHHRASAYLCEKDATAFSFSRLRQDLNVKLLQQDAREYSSGLMLMQRPYAILKKHEMSEFKDKIWVSHISAIYDLMTQQQARAAEEPEQFEQESSGADGSWQSEPGDAVEVMASSAEVQPEAQEPPPPPPPGGKRGKAGKGAGKSKLKGKGKGREPSKGKGKEGGADAGPAPAAAEAVHADAAPADAVADAGAAAAAAAAAAGVAAAAAAQSSAAAAVSAARGWFGGGGDDGASDSSNG